MPIYPRLVPARADHPRLHELVERLAPGGGPRPVPLAGELLPFGNCYWNAHAYAQRRAGAAVHGWMLSAWEPYYLYAEHHAVWQDPSGDLLDVTAPSPADASGAPTMFLPDASRPVLLDRLPCVECVFVALGEHTRVNALATAYKQKNAAMKALADLQYAAGYRCEHHRRSAGLAANIPSLVPPPHVAEKMKYWHDRHRAASLKLGHAVKSLGGLEVPD